MIIFNSCLFSNNVFTVMMKIHAKHLIKFSIDDISNTNEKRRKSMFNCYFNPIRIYALKWLSCVLCTISDRVMLNKIGAM